MDAVGVCNGIPASLDRVSGFVKRFPAFDPLFRSIFLMILPRFHTGMIPDSGRNGVCNSE
jgi:hypothetical protein